MKFACSNCSQHIDVENDWVGTKVTCPTCGIAIIVPTPKEAAASLNPPPPKLPNIVSPTPTSGANATSPDSGAGERIRKDRSANPESRPTNPPSATLPGFTKHAFISHSSHDRELAVRICAMLESNGVNCWIAPRNIDPGAPYDEEIMRGLTSSQTFILLLSDFSNASDHVKRELMVALRAGHAVYPIRIQEVQPGPKLEYLLEGIHWVDAWTPPIEAHLDRLAKLITTGHSQNVDSPSRTPEHTQPRKKKSRALMAWIAVILALAAGVWVASIWKEGLPDHPQSPLTNLPPQVNQPTNAIDNNVNQTNKVVAHVNQTVTLGWMEDPLAVKRYPSSDQILDSAGQVLGEVSLIINNGNIGDNRQIAHFDFKGSKGMVRLCDFRWDDPVGQRRIGKAEGVSFSGQVMGLQRNKSGEDISNITVQVTANTSSHSHHANAQKPDVNHNLMLSWVRDLKVVKRYPSRGQILDVAGDVVGEVGLVDGWEGSSLSRLTFYDLKNKETALCGFRWDDPVGQRRIGNAGDISVSGLVMELAKSKDSRVAAITVEITAKRPASGNSNIGVNINNGTVTDSDAGGVKPQPPIPTPPEPPVDKAVTEANATCTALAADPLNQTLLRQLRQRADKLTNADAQARCLAAYALGCQLTGNATEAANTTARLNTQAAGTRYVRLLSADNLSEPCAACQGRGTFTKPCTSCTGSGGRCSFCKGSGRIQFQLTQTNTPCPNCKDGVCRTCGGKGQTDSGRCLACNGQGKKVTTDRIRAVYLELLRS